MSCTTCVDTCTCEVTGDGLITVTGNGSAGSPFVLTLEDPCEATQDCVATMLDTQGFVYDDVNAQFDNAGAAGTILTADGVGGAAFLPLPAISCEDIQDCVGGMLTTQGLSYNDLISGFSNTGDSQSVLTSDGGGGASFIPRGRLSSGGRLTLTSGTPVTTSNVTSATIFYTGYSGNKISLFNGTTWVKYSFTEMSIVPGAVTGVYDVYMWADPLGVLALELRAWSTSLVRGVSADIALLDGIWVLASDSKRRLLGTAYISSGNVEDSLTSRYLWNATNRILRPMFRSEPAASWSYVGATRPANNNVANRLNVVIGIGEDSTVVDAVTALTNPAHEEYAAVGIGIDSTTVAQARNLAYTGPAASTGLAGNSCEWVGYTGIGTHYFQQLEQVPGPGAVTYIGAGFTVISGEVFS